MMQVTALPPGEGQEGYYSSTSGTYFADKDALQEHYRSDYHRYNLKRKVAELPPVTREWFDARKQQLNMAANSSDVQKVCVAHHDVPPWCHTGVMPGRRNLLPQQILYNAV